MKGYIKKCFNMVSSLIKEPDNSKELSLGRVSFIALIVASLYIWLSGSGQGDIPDNMQNIIIALMVYVLGGKVTSKIGDIVQAIRQIRE